MKNYTGPCAVFGENPGTAALSSRQRACSTQLRGQERLWTVSFKSQSMNDGPLATLKPHASSLPALAAALLLLAMTILLLSFFHVGFQASDDINYVTAALGWLNQFPYVGNSHWTLRHTVNLPTAGFIGVLGMREWVVSLTGISYFLVFLAMNAYFARRFFGVPCALLATTLVLFAPGFPVLATYLNPDVPELFFVSASFWALLLALEQPLAWRRWLLVGFLAGLGFINRQTAAAFVLFAGLLFVFLPGAPRKGYGWAAFAFAVTVALDWLYLTISTGDPAYRMRVDFNHDPVNRFSEAARVAASGGWIDKEGNITVSVYLDPLINAFLSQKYSLLFWLLLPAGWLAWRERRRDAAAARISLLVALGLVSFFFIALNPKLYLVPRYFLPAAWVASLAGAWWLSQLFAADRGRWACALLASSVGVGVLAYSIENVDPRATERTLVRWVQARPGVTIHTDIETARRSVYYFRFAQADETRVSAVAPGPGAIFFYSEARQQQCAASPRCKDRILDFRPQPQWQEQERLYGPRRPISRVLLALGTDRLLPADIARRLLAPTAEVIIYRIP